VSEAVEAQWGSRTDSWALANVHRGVVPALEIAVAMLGSLAFVTWVPVVRGLAQAQTELARPYGSVALD
jgi:hypothetical protein